MAMNSFSYFLPMAASLHPAAKMVFHGEIFDVYQWQQKMYDGTFATFERLRRADTVCVIPILNDGRILVTKQEQPGRTFLGFPGGRVEKGESPEQAAVRELSEETGYRVQTLVPWLAEQPVNKMDWTVHTFIGKGCAEAGPQHLDSGEKVSLQPVGFDELLDLVDAGMIRGQGLMENVLRAKLDPEKMAALRRLLSV